MMQWDLNLSCNHVEIDNQHKKLVDIINRVSSVLVEGNYKMTMLLDVVSDLDNYVEEHFAYEEKLMRLHNYPEKNEHIIEHNNLRLKLKDLNLLDIENHEEFYSDTLIYLVEWLTNHIIKVDKNFGVYLALKEK